VAIQGAMDDVRADGFACTAIRYAPGAPEGRRNCGSCSLTEDGVPAADDDATPPRLAAAGTAGLRAALATWCLIWKQIKTTKTKETPA
jgi:hypothetical protein